MEVDLASVDPHDLASLLKKFLRELPIPLLTWEFLDAFTQTLSKDLVLPVIDFAP